MQVFFLILATVVALVSSIGVQEQKSNSTSALGGLFKAEPAVTELDLSKYTGYWYEMYMDAIVENTIQKDNFCATATYGEPDSEGHVSVKNFARIGGADASYESSTIVGYAYVPNADKPGELKVKFDEGQGAAPFAAPYWVLETGPVNEKGQYDWAIVSDNLSQFLFVLARDYDVFYSTYDADVQVKLTDLGFKGYKKPIAIHQGTDCDYKQ